MHFEQQKSLRTTLRSLLSPIASELGLYISAFEFGSDHRGPIVRIFLDSPNGVTISQCTRFSKEISPVMDVQDPITSAYVLEISSPGVDRILELPEDFERFKGFHITVKTQARRKKRHGILGESDQEGFFLILEHKSSEETDHDPVNQDPTDQKRTDQKRTDTKRINFNDVVFARLNPTEEEFTLLAQQRSPSQKPNT